MKVALMFHGDRETRDTVRLAEHRLGPTAEAFRAEGFEVEPCVYNDDFADEVRNQLRGVDGVQVWVNPITDNARNRSKLDALLSEVAEGGVLVSAHPATIRKMGTKTVLYDAREMAWGSDVRLYLSLDQMRSELPRSLCSGPRVLKQHRGHSGQGIWKVSPTDEPDKVIVRHAPRGSTDQVTNLGEWIDSCADYFAQGPMIDQAFNPRIVDGMVRCYLNIDQVGGFGFQEVNALVPDIEPGPRLYYPPTDPRFQDLKDQVEGRWLAELLTTLDMTVDDLPCLWDVDFMYREGGGYILCEINVSSVYPYPDSAMLPLAKAFKRRLAKVVATRPEA